MQVDQNTHLYHTDALVSGCAAFSAQASLTNAAAQNVPPSALATSLTDTLGVLVLRPGCVITRMRVRFTGDVLNIGGQTITVQLLNNGVAHASGVIAGIATTAGALTGAVDFAATPLAPVVGDVLRVTITPSGALTAVVTDVMVAVG